MILSNPNKPVIPSLALDYYNIYGIQVTSEMVEKKTIQ
jgi:hypothetical protein